MLRIGSLERSGVNALAYRLTSTFLLLACGITLGGCLKTADMVDAALMTSVLVEDFETPAIETSLSYKGGQSFQTAASLWEVAAGDIDWFRANARPETAAFDGNQAVQLSGSPTAGILLTSFPTKPNQQYHLTFHYAHNNLLGQNDSRARIEVFSAGTTLLEGEVSHQGLDFNSYRRYSGIFTANSNRATLRFTSLTPGLYGITLDGISIRAVPRALPTPGR
jgi:hypothetical protein